MNRFGDSTFHLARRVGDSTVELARRVGDSTADLARRVGPKRGVLGLILLAAAVGGGIYLVRYFRARAEQQDIEQDDIGQGTEAEGTRNTRKHGRSKRRPNNVQPAH